MTDRPGLAQALRNQAAEHQAAADARSAPARDQRETALKADAALYGTAGWDALPAARQAIVANYVRQTQQGGGSDAA